MNSMVTVPRKAHKPKRAGSPRIPGVPWPDGPPPPGRSSPPPGTPGPEWLGLFSRTSVDTVGVPFSDRGRIGLHHVVGLHPGDGVVDSSPFAFQGLGGAFGPLKTLHRRFTRKRSCDVPSTKALIVMNWLTGCSSFRNVYW